MADSALSAERFARDSLERAPACQWIFDRAHRFQFVAGDSRAIFRRPASELHCQHVSVIDDPRGSWTGLLDLAFSGNGDLKRPEPAASNHALIHISLRAEDKSVLYAAGFAYGAEKHIPSQSELEPAALLMVLAVESERVRTSVFLRDVVAQRLGGAGRQMELLRTDLDAHGIRLADRTREIQQSLEDALHRVRQFS